jgi:hypothetical protein
MKQYFIGFEKEIGIRHQPWSTAEHDETEKYYDFRQHPELIREVLEDYKPWDIYKSVQDFYSLIEWLNSSESPFETNDCAFAGIKENKQRELAPKKFVAAGRLMVFFKDEQLNVSPDRKAFYRPASMDIMKPDYEVSKPLNWLTQQSSEEINRQHPAAEWNCIGIEIYSVFYDNAKGTNDEKLGYELSYKFWSWGDTDEEVMENFGLVVDTLKQTFRNTSGKLLTERNKWELDVYEGRKYGR